MNLNIHNKLYKKSVIALILASILIGSAFVGVGFGFLNGYSTVNPTYPADYITIEGVAGNDYYGLDSSRQYCYDVNSWAALNAAGYPALNPVNTWFNASKSLRIGMTEYGEFATPANTGIAYGYNASDWAKTESWASTAINQALYIQGWVFYMNYTRGGTPYGAPLRCVEAWATYSDLATAQSARNVVGWDGSKNPGESLWSPVTGSLITSGIEILYDSARLGVVRTNVVIHDSSYPNEDVAKITFTVILNKDTKYMIVYKDIKILIDPKVLTTINDFAFSERYEIDLVRNINPSNTAFIHWYHNVNATVYQHPLTGSNLFDIVQAYDGTIGGVGKQNIYFAAYWPNCTEYSVANALVPDLPTGFNTRILPQGTAVADIVSEPNTPWVTAQWRYQSWNPTGLNYYPHMLTFLAKDAQREIRFVEVAGMTDYNKGQPAQFRASDAQDPAAPVAATNVLDIEVRYLLNSVFNPEDLYTAQANPFMWLAVGQSAATTDNAGGAAMASVGQWLLNTPLGLFDRNDTAFPWTAPVLGMKGSIPYGLDNEGNFDKTTYLETFSNTGKSTGNDGTNYVRTGLDGFVLDYYDGSTTAKSPPQPIAGGLSSDSKLWYPSRNPLYTNWYTGQNGRWATTSALSSFTTSLYGTTFAEGIITLGGMKANGITRYFNDFNFAISREGNAGTYMALVNGGTVTGTAPTSNALAGATPTTLDYFPLSTWASSTGTQAGFGYTAGYAVIALARDINGTRGLSVYGWDGRDTYWAAAWASQYLNYMYNSWIPRGTVAIVLNIGYIGADREPTSFTVVKALGTITEFGTNAFATGYTYDQALLAAAGSSAWGYFSLQLVSPLPLPSAGSSYAREWWYEKLPTLSIAKVDFDP